MKVRKELLSLKIALVNNTLCYFGLYEALMRFVGAIAILKKSEQFIVANYSLGTACI